MTLRSGDNLDHDTAVVKTILFLRRYCRDKKWFIEMNYHVDYPEEFKKQLPRNRDHFEHTFDFCIQDEHYKPLMFGEMNGEIGYWFQPRKSKNVYTIANPTRHSKESQKKNDKINMNYVEKYHPNAVYKVLLKEEVNGDAKDPDKEKNSLQYLQRELIDWIK